MAASAAAAMSLSAILTDAASAQCSAADLCSPSTCLARAEAVRPACDQSRSCARVSASDKPELARRLLINRQCLMARATVAECYSQPAPGHNQAMQSVQREIAACQDKLFQQ